jgi:hypothetical protein
VCAVEFALSVVKRVQGSIRIAGSFLESITGPALSP